ncbi:hypothetical protein PsorP6_014230 [Peronosclerospora sorghi]|uniref:Uncharacterized protein n=1 Tax=Peronosclerospora sorghi TaxID=230839 RepID=A0ACC0VI41_9STRA|nr:hypothetical protein PsorP6_014230 [Peronosclerospora sorghi]
MTGGGRSRGAGRKGKVEYRRVQTSMNESSTLDAIASPPTLKNKSRVVQLVDEKETRNEAPSCTFPSSLRSSLKKSIATPDKRFLRVEKDSAASSHERAHERPKRDVQGTNRGARQVISLAIPSPEKETGPKFVSTLIQSIDQGEERRSKIERREIQETSLRRKNHREKKHEAEGNGPYLGERGAGHRSVAGSKTTRKYSIDSVSSQRSDRSDLSHRSERYHDEYRSIPKAGSKPIRKFSGGASGQVPFKSSLAGSLSAAQSAQDVRVLKERPLSGTIGRSFRKLTPETTSRRSSLDGKTSFLRRVDSSLPVAGRSYSHGVRTSDLVRTPSAPSELKNNALARATSSPLQVIAHPEKEDIPPKACGTPVVDEVQRKRVAETLRERMELRKLERGSSLAQMMKASVRRKGSVDNAARQSPRDERHESEIDETPDGSHAEKEARTREYYAKLEKESADREAARRSTPIKSSLLSSIETDPCKTQPMHAVFTRASPPFKSSIAASIANRPVRTLKSAALGPCRSTVLRAKKLQYSLAELKRLKVFALPQPADLPSMKIVEIVQIRNPLSVSRQSARRFGVGYHTGRSIGSSIRKGARSDVRSTGRGPKTQGGLRDGRRDRQSRGGRGGTRGGRGRGDYGRQPSAPLYDGPIEPLKVSENRWKPTKEKKLSALEQTLNHVKSLLNKLTREKFTKLTDELCAVDIDNFLLLSSIVSIIMDKALEEPNFADVYSDLCKEFHTRTNKKPWRFLNVLSDENGSFFWTAIDKNTFSSFIGPFDSPNSCLEDLGVSESTVTSTCDYMSIPAVQFRRFGDYLVAMGEKESGAFYYSTRKMSEISDEEPFGGPFESAELAFQAGASQTTFTRLLVNRCQGEFEKANKHLGPREETQEGDEIDPRRREVLAMRAKAKMLGNIRFIGELYKVDLIKQSGVQGCLLYLLGLELISGTNGQEDQAQAVRSPDEADLEALCKMLATAGKKFDQPKTKTIMKIIILRMVELSNDTKLPSRARFLVKDVLETRDHMWEPRRQEMQQKTLEEVRREAEKLQQQGKNAQHDDVQRRRHKARISSAQLAQQSSNLIVAKKEALEEPEEAVHANLSPAQMSTRIKSIINEYLSIMDLDEAKTCVQELPVDPYHIEFAEQTINAALEGKTNVREHAVELLVGLYERGALDANSIQSALINVMEFLEDLKIDLPLVHQYSALIFGRLVAAGCFGLSWIISEALAHCVECKLTSLVFPEVLSVLEMEIDTMTVIRMLTDEEVTPDSVLPAAMRTNSAEVEAYLREHGIEDFFGGDSDEDGELDPETAGKMRTTLEEYLIVKDLNELVQCIEELAVIPDWRRHFVHILFMFSIDAKQSDRQDMAELLVQLVHGEKIASEDIEAAVEIIVDDYDDLRVDIPQLAANLSELWTPLFAKQVLSVHFVSEACSHLVETSRAADVLHALLSALESQNSQETVVAWWKQSDADTIWTLGAFQDERLAKWKKLLQ